MIVPDANLLLYAYDTASPFHNRARQWWVECPNGSQPVVLTHPLISVFPRISTNPRVFRNPLSLQIAGWYSRRVVRTLLPESDHHSTVLSLLRDAGSAGGNLVTDAQVAAIALAHKAEVHTANHDFRRFPDLRCRFPLDL